MGKKLKVWVAVGGAALVLWSGFQITGIAEGDTATPGSVDDPVITKSYMDKQVAQAVQEQLSKQGISDQKLDDALEQFRNEMLQQQGAGQIEVVSVPPGKIMIAKDGAEFVVRAGKAVAYSADVNGLSDLTAGADITNGTPVPNNHLILFPRGGRGIMAAEGQKGNLIVLVKGEYELQDADQKINAKE